MSDGYDADEPLLTERRGSNSHGDASRLETETFCAVGNPAALAHLEATPENMTPMKRPTDGPFHLVGLEIHAATGLIGSCRRSAVSTGETEANARLFAASHDLMKVVGMIVLRRHEEGPEAAKRIHLAACAAYRAATL
mgnify:CR=1 FL=1